MIKSKNQQGFTLIEIVVATTVFAIVFVALLSLFNYVLKINRRSEALRQASQGARNFVELLVKEVRNGQVDYFVNNGSSLDNNPSPPFAGNIPCQPPLSVGSQTYYNKDNKIAIFNTDNVQECFYLGTSNGSYVDTVGQAPQTFSAQPNQALTLVMQKAGVGGPQILNPPNFRIDQLMFLVRPICDPYTSSCSNYGNGYPKVQPSVEILIRFTVTLPTGEKVAIPYQTAVSENKYDIPH